MAVSLTGTASLTLPTKSQLSTWNNTSDETFITQLSQGEGTLRWFLSHSDQTLIEVIMTWTIRVQTTPTQPV